MYYVAVGNVFETSCLTKLFLVKFDSGNYTVVTSVLYKELTPSMFVCEWCTFYGLGVFGCVRLSGSWLRGCT